MQALLTIGYEGATLEDFVSTLLKAGVTTLLDVRELPISRRKGFSKTALSEAVRAVGIDYRHERDLGSPKPIRHRLHSDGDYEHYFKSFTSYLNSQKPLLRQLAEELDGQVALMCFERDPTTCHRSIVAKHLEALTKLRTRHLGVRNGESGQRTRTRVGEGLPAA
jgi:uncharacterized protein (DUF488 family)